MFPYVTALVALVMCGCLFDPKGASATDAAVAIDSGDSDASISLIDEGLVVRYYMDEAASGTMPINLLDTTNPSTGLPISYGQAQYTEVDGNRGLRWSSAGGDGLAEIGLGTMELSQRLRDADRLTIEIVVDIDGAGSGGEPSELTGMRGGMPDFMLRAEGDEIEFLKPSASLAGTWPGVNQDERMVLHLVWDTTETNLNRRVQLHKDGVLQARSGGIPPPQGATVNLTTGDSLVVGNSRDENRSIEGTIFYVAYYDVPLSPAQIANNASRLIADDDQ